MVIPSKSKRSIRSCWECVHYNADNDHDCNLDFAYDTYYARSRKFGKQVNNLKIYDGETRETLRLSIAIEFPCIHHFTEDELKEIGESML